MSKRMLFFLCGIAMSICAHALELIFFALNRAFIEAKIGALPLNFQIALEYAQGKWWTFLLSLVVGFAVAAILAR